MYPASKQLDTRRLEKASAVVRVMRNATLILAALALISGCGGGYGESGSGEVTVDLAEQTDSGQTGTVMLTADGENTTVVIALDNPTSVPQPAHIHMGTCAKLDPTPAYGLENVVRGKSTTVVNEELGALRDQNYAINVHKSGAEFDVYVACGDIGSGSGGTGMETDDGGDGRSY